MNELELRLQELGGEIAYPATPRFELALRPPARAPVARCARSRSRFAVLLAVARRRARALARAPAARSSRSSTSAARPSSASRRSRTCARSGSTSASASAARRPSAASASSCSTSASEPDAIFVRPDGLASVVYGDPANPRLVLSQARGAVWNGFIKKTAGRGTIIDEVTVDGEPGLFVAGPDSTSSCSWTRTG